MACAVGKYARRLRMSGLVLATAHDDVCAYLQPDWCYDVAADALYLRPTEKPQRPKVSFACDWTHGGLPDQRDRRKNRETDLVREITASYSIEPEAIEKVVLGDGKLPEDYKCQVKVDACAKAASAAFDFEFDGNCVFAPPDFPASKIKGAWSIGVVHGPSGSGKTTVLRRVFKGVADGKVATREPDWDMNATVAKLFRDKFGEVDAAARLDAAAVDDDERSSRIDELTQCGRARCQIAWLLASECVLDEFIPVWKSNFRRPTPSTIPNSLVDFRTGSRPSPPGPSRGASRRASRPTSRNTTCSASSARRCTRTS